MALKDWFRDVRSRGTKKPEKLTINELIGRGQLEEARARLEAKLKKAPRHRHSRLKLGDLLMRLGRPAEAVDQYLEVADGYASDGFFDKAHALLAKLARMMPHEGKLVAKMQRLERAKELERRRGVVQEAIRAGGKIRTGSFAVQHLWNDMVKCPLVEQLSEEQLVRFFRAVDVRRVDEEKTLVEAGEQRYEMYVIVQGEVAAQILLPSGKRTDLRVFSSGDILGEDALLRRKSWPATYLAKRRTSTLKLDRKGLEELLVGEENPRGLLDALRVQGHDREVTDACSKLGSAGEE